eukprot:2537933-Rhodomonas_salina.2
MNQLHAACCAVKSACANMYCTSSIAHAICPLSCTCSRGWSMHTRVVALGAGGVDTFHFSVQPRLAFSRHASTACQTKCASAERQRV